MSQSYKGVRDFYPEDQRVQEYLFERLRATVRSYGYEEMNASVLEPTELYSAKSNAEMVREETYTFEDRGGRSVTLRPEMTPTVSRMVAERKRELGYPLRWYSIQNFFRYDRQQRGRLREFWQLNADIFGVADSAADLEIIELAHAALTSFGLQSSEFEIRVGSRKALERVFLKAGVSGESAEALRTLLDRRAKMTEAEFVAARSVLTKEPVEDIIAAEAPPEIIALLAARGIKAVYDPAVVRGFEYYTDIVFEAFDTSPENQRSILGGGRYDDLVGLYGAEQVPAVGFAVGDVVLADVLRTHGRLPKLFAQTKLYLAPIGESEAAWRAASALRAEGLSVALGMKHEKIGDHIRAAEKLGIQYFAAFGESEAAGGELLVKHLPSGTEKKLLLADISKVLCA